MSSGYITNFNSGTATCDILSTIAYQNNMSYVFIGNLILQFTRYSVTNGPIDFPYTKWVPYGVIATAIDANLQASVSGISKSGFTLSIGNGQSCYVFAWEA